MKKFLLLFTLLAIFMPSLVSAEGLKSFTLKNGLTVFVWEDPSQTEVFGAITVRAGSVDDPAEFTGAAHYLEHLMFKGTERIGALNWEEEKPIYDQIIAKYDERAKETDPLKIKTLDEEINSLTIKQASISQQNEMENLLETIGGTGMNAGTSYDLTVYYNQFPTSQLEKWLELYSTRMIKPVFRSFQTELETVYEEYNMYQDSKSSRANHFLMENAFAGHPYGREIIGYGNHLKNPQLSKVIEFYNKWYTPQNMALILVGNLKTEEIANIVNRKFSRLPVAEDPQPIHYESTPIKGRKQVTGKVGQVPQVMLVYDGVAENNDDAIAIEVMCEVLSNSSQTGLLDKLTLDGDVMQAFAAGQLMADEGRILVSAIPGYDYNQRRFESFKNIEKVLTEQLKRLANGDFEDWLLESVKSNMIRNQIRTLESSNNKAMTLASAFASQIDINRILNYNELVAEITKDNIIATAKKYLTDDYLALYIEESKNGKVEKIEKPKLPETQNSPVSERSEYAKWFELLESGEVTMSNNSFDDVKISNINEKSKLFYYPNPENDIFTMTIKYGIGERELSKLGIATDLMNTAGVMAAYDPQEFRTALSQLNAELSYYSNDDYTVVEVEGDEKELKAICNLITRQILMPDLDLKQLNNVKGRYFQMRRIEEDDIDTQEDALNEYIFYKMKSSYIDRLSEEDILNLSISDLTGEFQKATDYAAEVHYVGKLPFEEVNDILSANLPLKAKELESKSPVDKPRETYKENTVYFVNNSNATQSKIYFYINSENYSPEIVPSLSAFNQYFSGGFSSLVMNEIRVKNSMAYTTYGIFRSPILLNSPFYFTGFIGTQADKTIDAISLYMNLIKDMPQYPDRINGIKMYMRQALMAQKPNFRYTSQTYEAQKRLGYTEPMEKTLVPKIDQLTFDDIVSFYEKQVKSKPMVIGIIGDPKSFNVSDLEKFGKVERLNISKLFK